jgi:hypothetical protein
MAVSVAENSSSRAEIFAFACCPMEVDEEDIARRKKGRAP